MSLNFRSRLLQTSFANGEFLLQFANDLRLLSLQLAHLLWCNHFKLIAQMVAQLPRRSLLSVKRFVQQLLRTLKLFFHMKCLARKVLRMLLTCFYLLPGLERRPLTLKVIQLRPQVNILVSTLLLILTNLAASERPLILQVLSKLINLALEVQPEPL